MEKVNSFSLNCRSQSLVIMQRAGGVMWLIRLVPWTPVVFKTDQLSENPQNDHVFKKQSNPGTPNKKSIKNEEGNIEKLLW